MPTAALRPVHIAVIALLATGTTTLADAAPKFTMSGDWQRQQFARDCNLQFGALDEAQDLAEDLAEDGDIAGSEAASSQADAIWDYGVRKGCSWAQ